jgi:Ser/Thr protein kinase RdoA (MazF antagonist)
MLARLHKAASQIKDPSPRREYPAWRHLDWKHNRWWDLKAISRFLRQSHPELDQGLGSSALERRLVTDAEELPQSLSALADMDLPAMPIHNDYFEDNLLERDGAIVGVVDWDETALDWRALEIGNAAWSFSRMDTHAMDLRLAREFLADYESAGGRITGDERGALLLLIRARHIGETLFELGRACRGAVVDWEYLVGNLTATDSLAKERL